MICYVNEKTFRHFKMFVFTINFFIIFFSIFYFLKHRNG